MRHQLLILLALAMGSTHLAAAQARHPATKPAAKAAGTSTTKAASTAKTAAAAPAAVQLVDLDLTSAGVPVIVKAPAGAKIKVTPENAYSVEVIAPGFVLMAGKFALDGEETAEAAIKSSKTIFSWEKGTTVTVDEPLAYRKHHKDPKSNDNFAVGFNDPANGSYYMVSSGTLESIFDSFTPAQSEVMYTAVRATRLAKP